MQLRPYINFQGRAREAMEFYAEALGGQVELYAAGEGGTPRAAEPGEPVMYARLVAEGVTIVGSDGNPNYPPTAGDNIALALVGTDRERVARIFDALGSGGQVKMPLTRAPWGEAGWLRDRFGVNWNVEVEPA